MKSTDPHIALIGNPNCGKSTLFNRLTGLRQSTSNLPGTTVEQKSGIWKSAKGTYKLTDLPGIYSLFTDSDEEGIVVDTLLGKSKEKPNLLVFLLDASNLRRNLLLFTQVAEIGIPIIVGLTMSDTAARRGIGIDSEELSKSLDVPVILINPRKGSGIQELEAEIQNAKSIEGNIAFVDKLQRFRNGEKLRGIGEETLSRYVKIEQILKVAIRKKEGVYASATRKLDRVFTHPIMGYLAFAAIMLTIFQGVFTLAEYPMGWIENGFGHLATFIGNNLDDGFLRRIITGGILPGLSGVLVFLPQIAILFFFISVLEDSGYMVRASFITDKIMRRIGLNGRSVIPLIGGFACAIPSIMATRSIKNKGERLATMFIIPLMSCSARLPVYVLLVSLAVPKGTHFGPIGMQSFIMTLAYFAGILLAIVISVFIKIYRKDKAHSEFVMELPPYQLPRMQTVWTNVLHKSKAFVTEAGKIIMIISLVLWFLSSYGPGNSMEMAKIETIRTLGKVDGISKTNLEAEIGAAQLKASYAGIMGQWLEPAIKPLGYDWKTGIALVSSFAAREVFVGTMSTLFSNTGSNEIEGIRSKMKAAVNPETGKPLYGVPYALSLIMFYAFALQCMSTLAVMKRETGSWRLPIIQFIGFGIIAWLAAFAVYRAALFFS